MVPRKKYIINQLRKCKLDFKFYTEFCDLLNIYNDLENYFKIKIDDFESTALIMNIAYTIIKKVDINSLLHMYPMYMKDHAHFIIFSQKFQGFKSNFAKYIKHDIVQKNEWEENFFKYCTRQICFLEQGSEYILDYRELNELIIKYDFSSTGSVCTYKIRVDRYFEVYSNKFSKEHIFRSLFLLMQAEVLERVQ